MHPYIVSPPPNPDWERSESFNSKQMGINAGYPSRKLVAQFGNPKGHRYLFHMRPNFSSVTLGAGYLNARTVRIRAGANRFHDAVYKAGINKWDLRINEGTSFKFGEQMPPAQKPFGALFSQRDL